MKKGTLSTIICGVIVLVSFIAILFFAAPRGLGRDRDNEFRSGSGIEISQLSDLQSESLYKLCKVWGYAKYRHPSVIDGSLNWDAELFRVMPDVLAAGSPDEANTVLYLWLSQFPFTTAEPGSTARLWLDLQEEAGGISADAVWISDTDLLGEALSGYLTDLSQVYTADRGDSYASFDITAKVSFDNEQSLPCSPEDDGVKLLALFRFWNIYEYYSPNVSITKIDWDEALKQGIPKIVQTDTYRDYVLALAETAALTGDAQETLSRYIAVPEDGKIGSLMDNSLLKSDQDKARVDVIRNGAPLSLTVKCSESSFRSTENLSSRLISDGRIGYLNPTVSSENELKQIMSKFQDTEGIIVDLRYYPSNFIRRLLGEYLIPEPAQFATMSLPNPVAPGSFYFNDNCISGSGYLRSTGEDDTEYPLYQGRTVILMDDTSASRSEFTIMALRQTPGAVVVGSPSLGTDGDVVDVSLPGQISFSISGLGVYTPDGGQTQRIGLTPDIECRPTVEGIREGRDELVEKAVEIILSDEEVE